MSSQGTPGLEAALIAAVARAGETNLELRAAALYTLVLIACAVHDPKERAQVLSLLESIMGDAGMKAYAGYLAQRNPTLQIVANASAIMASINEEAGKNA